MFRAFVKEDLAAAAERILTLFQRKIAEYEEELRRSNEENQRKQMLLNQVLNPRVLLLRLDTGPDLNQGLNQDLAQEITQTPRIKEETEEQVLTQQEEQPPVSTAVGVKIEEPTLLQQRQTEPRKETQGEDIVSDSETEEQTEHSSDRDDDDDWMCPISCSPAKMETESDGDHYDQVQTKDRPSKLSSQNKSAPETSAPVNNGDMSGPDRGSERNKHQCSVCQKRFRFKSDLKRHVRVHTGEKPFHCSVCQESFTRNSSLVTHRRTHSGDKPYHCSLCQKSFAKSSNLVTHRRTHSGDKPFHCSLCQKSFAHSSNLVKHRRTHTGDKPFHCSVCQKSFAQSSNLVKHRRTHT